MATLVRASHPVYGTRLIPASWVTTYPGAWTVLDDGDPGPSPDPLPLYVRDVDLDAQMAALVPGNGQFAAAQRAAFGLGANATDAAVEAFVGVDGTKTRATLLRDFGEKRSISLPSGARVTPLPGALDNKYRYNAASFIADNVTTVGNEQYAVWVQAGTANPIIGKRNLGSDQWQTFDLSTIPGNPLAAPVNADGHNVYVVALDSTGRIHVAGDMHAHPLHYIRSTNPRDITAWEAPGMVGTDEEKVSYPQFIHRLSGELLFIYRQTQIVDNPDDNTASKLLINAYNPATKTWTRRSTPVDGIVSSPTSSPYWNRPAVGPDDSLHIFYLWRDGATNNPSIGHIRSLDGGVTWSQMGGAPTEIPVTKTSHVEVARIFALNQQGAAVDANGNPHAVFMANKGNAVAILHLYWNGTAWVSEDAVDHSREAGTITRVARPSVFCRGTDTYLIYTLGQTGAAGGGAQSIRIRNLSAADRHVDFPLIEANLGQFEPTFDQLALRNRDELVMLVTTVQPEAASTAGLNAAKHMRSWGGILTFPLSALRAAAGIADGAVMNERVWIPAESFLPFEGSPVLSARKGFPAWDLPDVALTSIAAITNMPDRWQGYNVDVWWANSAAGTGNISLTTTANRVSPGVNFDSVPAGSSTISTMTVAAGGSEVPTVTRVFTGRPNVSYDGDRLTRFVVRRSGSAGADTLVNTALILGIMLSPALIP